MPTSVNVNGYQTRRPGTSASVDASALAGAELTTNVLAVVGDFPDLQSATPTRFSNANQLKSLSSAYINQLMAQIIYNPANDDLVAGSPTAVVLVNGGASTQAQLVLLDTNGNQSLIVKSSVWGSLGNSFSVGVVNNADDATLRDITLTGDGVVETLSGVGSGILGQLGYTGAELTTHTVYYGPGITKSFVFNWTKDAIDATTTYVPVNVPFGGTIDFDVDAAPGVGEQLDLLITGVNATTGAIDTETVTFLAADASTQTTAKSWSSVTSIVPDDVNAGMATTTFDMTHEWQLASADFTTLEDIANQIDSIGVGMSFVRLSPKLKSYPTRELDGFASTDINGAAADIRGDLKNTIDRINGSLLFTAERTYEDPASGASDLQPPVAYTGVSLLSGGSFVAGNATTIDAAVAALRSENVQVVSTLYTDVTSAQRMRTHCQYQAALGTGERNAWVATAVGSTLDQIKTRTLNLNTRHVALATQEIQITDHTGSVVWIDPEYQALMFAAMQCSTPIGEPLTRKVANVLDVRNDSSWNADEDANDILDYGVCFLTTGRLGYKVERSITTYQSDDNPIFSEVSANESLDTCIRNLRENLEILIGRPGFRSTRANIKALAKQLLREQVTDEIIKGFNESSLDVEDLGDLYRVNVEVAPLEPVNFIEVAVKVVRIPSNS